MPKNKQQQLPEGSFATAAHQKSILRQEQINEEINTLRESLTEEEQLAQLIGSIAQKGQSAINQVRETVRDIITLTGNKELMTAFLQKMSDTIEEIGNEPAEAIEASEEEEEETYDILTKDDDEDNDEPDNDEPDNDEPEDEDIYDDDEENDLEEEEYEPKKQPTRLKTVKPKRPRRSPVKT